MFLSLLGAFQGDCLSGCLFTLVLAGALCELREKLAATMVWPNPPITIEGFPLETEYADDVDFMDEDEENLKKILPSLSMKTKPTSHVSNKPILGEKIRMVTP